MNTSRAPFQVATPLWGGKGRARRVTPDRHCHAGTLTHGAGAGVGVGVGVGAGVGVGVGAAVATLALLQKLIDIGSIGASVDSSTACCSQRVSTESASAAHATQCVSQNCPSAGDFVIRISQSRPRAEPPHPRTTKTITSILYPPLVRTQLPCNRLCNRQNLPPNHFPNNRWERF